MTNRGGGNSRGTRTLWIIVAVACILLVFTSRALGVLVALGLVLGVALYLARRPEADPEARTLRTSIQLACEDIEDTLGQFDSFATSNYADSLADRTMHRPALLEPDCDDPDISKFHFEASAARRFLTRLNARLANQDLPVRDLEKLLEVTDERGRQLRDSWVDARRAARRLGP